MFTAEQLAYIRLWKSLTNLQFYQAVRKYGSAQSAVKAMHAQLCDQNEVDAEIKAVESFKAQFLFANQDDYPSKLKHISLPPPVLIIKGKRELLRKQSVSIVGSRQASLAAIKMTSQLSKDLSLRGQIVVSGLAAGVDRHAHLGSLQSGTIAILGCGIDVVYPLENEELYKQIAQDGLLMTEFFMHYPVKRESFPARNRIISGLSWGLIIIEAGLKSGTMITAKHALAQNRDIFAVPGHPLDSNSRGCNALIKDGAILIESAQDVLDHYANKNEARYAVDLFSQTEDEEEHDIVDVSSRILSLLNSAPMFIDELIQHTQINAKTMRTCLLGLELDEKIHIDKLDRVFKLDE